VWITRFLDQACAFPKGAHDDQIDAVSGGFAVLREPAKNAGRTQPRRDHRHDMAGLYD
jgi:hypothetical protein